MELKYIFFGTVLLCYVSGVPINTRTNPDAGLKVPDLVTKYGYPVETYTVQTSDGYLLTLHRIPHGKNNNNRKAKPVVYLQHGLLCSSADWVLMGPEKGLAYILAERGYDVWLGNARGNTYSRQNVNFDPDKDEEAFWNFSWHQIGNIDVPAMIDFILEKTGQHKLSYIGHSQGTTAFFVMGATRPEYNEKIKVMIALAPVAFMGNIPNKPLRLISHFLGAVEWISETLGINEFLPSTKFIQFLAETMCDASSALQGVCSNILFLIAGTDVQELDPESVPVILSNTPAGSSTKQVLHYVQEIVSGNFCHYDFKELNQEKYGQPNPPDYDLGKVTAPVFLFYGQNDLLTAEEDVNTLHDRLGNCLLEYKIKYPNFSHLDFLWAKDVVTLLYNDVIDKLERF